MDYILYKYLDNIHTLNLNLLIWYLMLHFLSVEFSSYIFFKQ